MIEIFEEIRFVTELFIAEILFLQLFLKITPPMKKRLLFSWMGLSFFSMGYFVIKDFSIKISGWQWINLIPSSIVRAVIFISWYIVLVAISIYLLKRSVNVTKEMLIFIAVSAYALQHIEYILMHQIVSNIIFPKLMENVALYIALCIITCVLLYMIVLKIIKKGMDKSYLILRTNNQTWYIYWGLLVLVIVIGFMGQHSFLFSGTDYNLISALITLVSCFLVIYAQFSTLLINNLSYSHLQLTQMMKNREIQYHAEKGAVDLINQKTHDLKNQMLAFQHLAKEDKLAFVDEMLDYIEQYDTSVNLDNEAINTLLTQKYRYCQQNNINFTFMVDAKPLDFIDILDLYALLGNALDNAIECVEKYQEGYLRNISLSILQYQQFVKIQVTNPFLQDLVIEDGIIQSTKLNKDYHGFGLKSMQMILDQYEGVLDIQIDDDMFELNIIISIPTPI